MFDSVALHVNLQRQQQGEEELVFLVQPSCCIPVHLKGHELYDVGDAFAGDWAFGGPVHVTIHSRCHSENFIKLAAYQPLRASAVTVTLHCESRIDQQQQHGEAD